MGKVVKVTAREILDSRGNPTVEAKVFLEGGRFSRASVPSGASTGSHEALELRDGDKTRYEGKGVLQAVKKIEEIIGPEISGTEITEQEKIDRKMIELDGTENKTKLGANAILAVSLACARAGAISEGIELYQYLRIKFFGEEKGWLMPAPMMNVLNGGKHALGTVAMQEFMVVPKGETFNDRLRAGVETYQDLRKILLARGLPIGIGDEGGFAANLKNSEAVLELLAQTIKGRAELALDPAASEFYKSGYYVLEESRFSSEEMIKKYEDWVAKYPIVSIEDGLAEDDWQGWQLMTKTLGRKIQVVGDDLYATNVRRLERGIKEKTSNAILIKLNQIGTLTETVAAIKMAKKAAMKTILSHRSGETEDTFIADLAVAGNIGQIKAGAPARSERVVKYNRLLEIEGEVLANMNMIKKISDRVK